MGTPRFFTLRKCGFALTRLIPDNDTLRHVRVDDEECVLVQ